MSSPLSSSYRHSARLPPCRLRHLGRRPRCWFTFAPPAATKSADNERERHGERRRSLHRAEHCHVIRINPERRAHEQRAAARRARRAQRPRMSRPRQRRRVPRSCRRPPRPPRRARAWHGAAPQASLAARRRRPPRAHAVQHTPEVLLVKPLVSLTSRAGASTEPKRHARRPLIARPPSGLPSTTPHTSPSRRAASQTRRSHRRPPRARGRTRSPRRAP